MIDKKWIKELKGVLKDYEQVNFIDPELNKNKLLDVCRSILVESGYKILKPFNFSLRNVKNHHDLITLFYGLIAAKHPERINSSINKHDKRNLKTASLFLKSRMESGNVNRKVALLECAEIIKTLVDNLDDMGLGEDTLSFSIFGQANLGWITERAISILNKNIKLKSEKTADKLAAEYDTMAKKEVELGYNVEELCNNIEENFNNGR